MRELANHKSAKPVEEDMHKDMKFGRRNFLRTGIAAGGMTLAMPSLLKAATFPEGNIKVIIPFDRLHIKNAFKDLNLTFV